jgi:hypothetical protein
MKITLNEVKAMNEIAGTQMTKEQEIKFIKDRLQELEFGTQDAFDTYKKNHKMKPDTKVKIAGKNTTAGAASKKSGNSSIGNIFTPNKSTKSASNDVQTHLNKLLGTKDGYSQKGDGGAIEYNIAKDNPTYTLYMGKEGGKHMISLEPTYGKDPSNLSGKVNKEFDNEKDAMKYMGSVAKKYKKELEMQDK